MTSRSADTEAYVWVWLPGAVAPVVAGRLQADGGNLLFNYGRSYLDRDDAISLYDAELPLRPGVLPLLNGLSVPGCIRDGAPDSWGRRVIVNKLLGSDGAEKLGTDLDELTFLLESGSDRIGALDFQRSPTVYAPRTAEGATLDQLLDSAQRVEQGVPLASELDQALYHGSAIGGARPKALIDGDERKYVAKFSTSADVYSVVKAEFIAMRMAYLCGLDAAPVSLTKAAGKDVLLIERFDREKTDEGWRRKAMVSALTLLELDEMMARYASYEKLAEIIRHKFTAVPQTLKELFTRLTFNILCGNTDDHARNHAAFWDGSMLTLTPAYDICPQGRTGNVASQAMRILGADNASQIALCLDAAHHFQLTRDQAQTIVTNQINVIERNWASVCDEADLSDIDRRLLWRRQFLNPFALEGI